jgi:hypothetical protein
MNKKKPPSAELALRLAAYYWTCKKYQISWDWVFVWAFYDHWVEEYFND